MSADLKGKLYALYAAFGEGKIDLALNSFDETAAFISYTPIDVFPRLGRQTGKVAIAAMMTNMHAEFEHITFQPIFIVAEESSAAAIIMVRLRQRSTDRTIHLLTAHFIQFRDGKVIELREFMDSFDAVQQVLGRELDISKR